MSRKFAIRMAMSGAVGVALGISPIAALAQVDIPCPGVGAPACSTFNIPIAASSAQGTQQANVDNSGNAGASTVISAPSQGVASSALAQNGSQNDSFNGHAVSVGGRTFRAAGGGESFVSLGVGGASNTGGAPIG